MQYLEMRFIRNIIILSLLISSILPEEQGKYVRKSITALDYVYVHSKPVFWPWQKKAGWVDMSSEFDKNSFNKMIDFYVGNILEPIK